MMPAHDTMMEILLDDQPPRAYGGRDLMPSFAAESLCNASVAIMDMEAWTTSDTNMVRSVRRLLRYPHCWPLLALTRATSCVPLQPPVTYFVLHVRLGNSSYCVRRRFKDFDTLYAALCHAHGKHTVPQLPPKQVIKNETADFLRERKLLLSDFLLAVFDDKVLSMSPELCAFLECEAGATLATANADLASCTGMLVAEVSAAEALASARADALAASDAELTAARLALVTETAHKEDAQRDASTALAERDAARAATVAAEATAASHAAALATATSEVAELRAALGVETLAKEAALAELHKPNVGDALSAALSAAINRVGKSPTKDGPNGEVVESPSTAPAERLTTDAPPAFALPISLDAGAEDPSLHESDGAEAAPHTPGGVDEPAPIALLPGERQPQVERPFWVAKRPSGAAMPDTAPAADCAPAPPMEHAIKCGLLMKQGAGNKAYQERYFELVSLGAAGECVLLPSYSPW